MRRTSGSIPPRLLFVRDGETVNAVFPKYVALLDGKGSDP